MKTKTTKEKEIKREWHLYDASGKILGRLATDVVQTLLGKKKPYFTPHLDCGDFVVVVNARKVAVTGKKEKDKIYYRHSGYPGGLKETPLEKVRLIHPERIIEHAVSGMLPKNKLRSRWIRKLFVFPEENHTYQDKKFIVHD